MKARERAVGHLRIEGRQASIEFAHQDVANGDAQRRIETVARHEHQDRGKAFEPVKADEQRRAGALLQMQNAKGGLQ